MTRAARREVPALAALVLLPLLLFADAAVSIDAPVFLAVAKQVVAHPGDPFGFEMLWDPSSPRVAEFNLNPPLLSYYLAPCVALFGESEIALHLWLLPFPLLAAFSFLGIARRAAGEGLAPAALLVTTPVFVVLATTLMLDVPALALSLFAVYALLRGAEGGGVGWPLLAGLAAAAAGLVKYVALATAPLLAAGVVLLYRRRAKALLAALGVPLAIWGLWCLHSAWLYGRPHLLAATDFGAAASASRGFTPAAFWNQLASLPIYYGATLLFPVWVAARALVLREAASAAGVLGLVLGAAAVTLALPEGFPRRRNPLELEEALVGILALAGAFALWVRVLAPGRWRASALDAFLALWLAGFAVFSLFLNWHVTAADALLAAPPALLLLYRTPGWRPGPRAAAVAVALSLALSLGLAWAECEQADAYRDGARLVAAEIGERPGGRWHAASWGFQYYLERQGFRGIPPPEWGVEGRAGPSGPGPGDWLAVARNLTPLSGPLDHLQGREVKSWTRELALPLRTTNPDAGAGFYSHRVGYLPWAFDTRPLDRIALIRLTR